MDIQRIDSYTDSRFSKTVLQQHGAYLIGSEPYEIEITGLTEAVIRGKDPAVKLAAVRSFIRQPEDVIIQVIPYGDRYISLDGHTRLYAAAQDGFRTVRAVLSETDDWVWPFVREAEKRKIFRPRDLILLPHDEYEIQWNQYCDSVFAQQDPGTDR